MTLSVSDIEKCTGIFSSVRHLNASECNAQRVIPLPLLIQWLLETATDHSTSLGVGLEDLAANNNGWVMSRLTLEMTEYPGMNSTVNIDTWVPSINRRFTERCFRISASDGRVLGYARTTWSAIDLTTRRAVDLSAYIANIATCNEFCPIDGHAKIQHLDTPDAIRRHTFQYCDIDFNRHVNSTRYIECILNDRSVAFFDTHRITRFEIAFMSETRYDDEVHIARCEDEFTSTVEITRNGEPVTRARITYNTTISENE